MRLVRYFILPRKSSIAVLNDVRYVDGSTVVFSYTVTLIKQFLSNQLFESWGWVRTLMLRHEHFKQLFLQTSLVGVKSMDSLETPF